MRNKFPRLALPRFKSILTSNGLKRQYKIPNSNLIAIYLSLDKNRSCIYVVTSNKITKLIKCFKYFGH